MEFKKLGLYHYDSFSGVITGQIYDLKSKEDCVCIITLFLISGWRESILTLPRRLFSSLDSGGEGDDSGPSQVRTDDCQLYFIYIYIRQE